MKALKSVVYTGIFDLWFLFFAFFTKKSVRARYLSHKIYVNTNRDQLLNTMKRITTLLLTVLFIVSCSKDNDDVINVELEGQWELSDALCFCFFGDDPDFSTHKISFEGSTLVVTNSGEFEFLNTAEGAYQVSGNLITLSNDSQYRYTMDGNVLTLTFVDKLEIADDELTLLYIRE